MEARSFVKVYYDIIMTNQSCTRIESEITALKELIIEAADESFDYGLGERIQAYLDKYDEKIRLLSIIAAEEIYNKGLAEGQKEEL